MEQNDLVTVELLSTRLLKTADITQKNYGDSVCVELISRKREVLLKCPVCQTLLEANVPSVECLVDETKYCRTCANELARENERCWMCGLFSFHHMLEIS